MKKIGILYGKEKEFPEAVIDYINEQKLNGIKAECIHTGAVTMEGLDSYHVILDRISPKVPFYNSLLKSAVLNGTEVVNNPFWNAADDNFFHSVLASKTKINTPKTVLLPSKQHPDNTSAKTFRNLIFPLNWDEIFNYTGFPAKLKSINSCGKKQEFVVFDRNEFFSAYDLSGKDTMVLQEVIPYDKYYRVFVVGKKHVMTLNYNPENPLHMRYTKEPPQIDTITARLVRNTAIKICESLGFDINAVDFGIHNKQVYLYDLVNMAPVAERKIMHENNFNKLVEITSGFLMELAEKRKVKKKYYNWSELLSGR